MKKQDFIQLTVELYDLTAYFPNKEPLRYKIRGLANDILSDLLMLISNPGPTLNEKKKIKNRVSEDIKVLEDLFEVAKPQDWVSPDDLMDMKQEYSRIKEAVESVETTETDSSQQKVGEKRSGKEKDVVKEDKVDLKAKSVSKRQKGILKELKENGHAQVSDLKEKFSDVSRRTLIRDLNDLTDQGLVKKAGKGPSVFYSLNEWDRIDHTWR